jgi:hypothetical protein
MPQNTKSPRNTRRPANDFMHGLRELAAAIQSGRPLAEQFRVRTVSIPDPAHPHQSRVVAGDGVPGFLRSPESSGTSVESER